MASVITTLSSSVKITEVSDVIVTEIVTDEDGNFVREFRFFGPPPAAGGSLPLIFTVRTVGETRTVLEISTPVLGF